MPTVEEGAGQTQLAAGLAAGVETLSLGQEIVFTKYVKQILPLDGYVFWIRADLLTASALKAAGTDRTGLTIKAKGSLHYATNNQQREDETLGQNRVVFTSLTEIEDFNAVSPTVLYIAEFEGIRFSFNARRSFYRQAELYHYEGDAVYPALATQIIDSASQINPSNLIVSNSLPIWLSLNAQVTVYPSFLIPDNIEPPYAACHIGENDTRALQPIPRITDSSSHWQLAADRVRITLYGLNNDAAMDWQDYILGWILANDGVMGLMNMPIVRDAKRTQSEMNVIAQKKVIEFEVSYYQARVRGLARQRIEEAFVTLFINPL